MYGLPLKFHKNTCKINLLFSGKIVWHFSLCITFQWKYHIKYWIFEFIKWIIVWIWFCFQETSQNTTSIINFFLWWDISARKLFMKFHFRLFRSDEVECLKFHPFLPSHCRNLWKWKTILLSYLLGINHLHLLIHHPILSFVKPTFPAIAHSLRNDIICLN